MTTIPPRTRHPLRLPAGSIRGLMSLLITGLFWTLLLLAKQKNITIPLFLYFLSGMVLLFFVAHGKTITPPGQTPPFGMPRGTLRFLIVVGTLVVFGVYWYQNGSFPVAKLTPTKDQLEYWPQLTAAMLVGLLGGWIVGRGPWRDSAFFQDIQAWVSLLAMLGLVIEVIAILVVNPSLDANKQIQLHLFEAILTGIIAWYFGSRS